MFLSVSGNSTATFMFSVFFEKHVVLFFGRLVFLVQLLDSGWTPLLDPQNCNDPFLGPPKKDHFANDPFSGPSKNDHFSAQVGWTFWGGGLEAFLHWTALSTGKLAFGCTKCQAGSISREWDNTSKWLSAGPRRTCPQEPRRMLSRWGAGRSTLPGRPFQAGQEDSSMWLGWLANPQEDNSSGTRRTLPWSSGGPSQGSPGGPLQDFPSPGSLWGKLVDP